MGIGWYLAVSALILRRSRYSRAVAPAGVSHSERSKNFVANAVTRSVRDSAALLDATQGPDPGAPYVAPPRERPYREEVGRDPGKLRIAFTTRSLLGSAVHPDCAAAVQVRSFRPPNEPLTAVA